MNRSLAGAWFDMGGGDGRVGGGGSCCLAAGWRGEG